MTLRGHYIKRLTALLGICLVGALAYAAGGGFVRVRSAERFAVGDKYIVAARRAEAPTGLYALSAEPWGRAKLKAVAVGDDEERIDVADDALVWTIDSAADGLALRHAAGKYVAVGAGATDLLAADGEPCVFSVSFNAEGEAFLGSAGVAVGDTRFLALSTLGAATFFGYYKESGVASAAVMLYKYVGDANSLGMPEDGAEVGIGTLERPFVMAGDAVNAYGAPTSTDAAGARLHDGTFARVSGLAVWTVERTEGGFALRSHGGYLQAAASGGLRLSSAKDESCVWSLEGGRICIARDGDTLALAFGYAPDEALTLVPLSYTYNKVRPAALVRYAPAGQMVVSAGLATLSGGWTAAMLRDSLARPLGAIDLRDAVLPDAIPTAPHAVSCGGNVLTYTAGSQAALLPDTWPNVVVGRGDAARLVRPMTIADARPLFIPYGFGVGRDSLSYLRSMAASEGWETCVLPFSPHTLPQGFSFATASGMNGNAVVFNSLYSLKSGEAFIFAYESGISRHDGLTAEFRAEEQWIAPTTADEVADGVLRGTYDTVRTDASHATVYMLAADGMRFVRAASGSMLRPFRAMIAPSTPTANASLGIAFAGTLGIESPTQGEGAAGGGLHTLSGVYVGRVNTANPPDGLYITGGRVVNIKNKKIE